MILVGGQVVVICGLQNERKRKREISIIKNL